MSYVIDEDFTHNEMIIEGKDAVNFFRNFQHVMHESRYFNVAHTKKIEYEFRYHGKPNHDYLVLVKKEFPFTRDVPERGSTTPRVEVSLGGW